MKIGSGGNACTKPNGLNLIPGNQVLEGETNSHKLSSDLLLMLVQVCMGTHACEQAHTYTTHTRGRERGRSLEGSFSSVVEDS